MQEEVELTRRRDQPLLSTQLQLHRQQEEAQIQFQLEMEKRLEQLLEQQLLQQQLDVSGEDQVPSLATTVRLKEEVQEKVLLLLQVV